MLPLPAAAAAAAAADLVCCVSLYGRVAEANSGATSCLPEQVPLTVPVNAAAAVSTAATVAQDEDDEPEVFTVPSEADRATFCERNDIINMNVYLPEQNSCGCAPGFRLVLNGGNQGPTCVRCLRNTVSSIEGDDGGATECTPCPSGSRPNTASALNNANSVCVTTGTPGSSGLGSGSSSGSRGSGSGSTGSGSSSDSNVNKHGKVGPVRDS
jgi:hypothetical protein